MDVLVNNTADLQQNLAKAGEKNEQAFYFIWKK